MTFYHDSVEDLNVNQARRESDEIMKNLLTYIYMPKQFWQNDDWKTNLMMYKQRLVHLARCFVYPRSVLNYVDDQYEILRKDHHTDIKPREWYVKDENKERGNNDDQSYLQRKLFR